MKNRFGLIAVTGLIWLSLFSTVSGLSPHPLPDTPYDEDLSDRVITLDPVGNHTTGDVFTIHGVTSLPAGRKLIVSMHLGGCRVGYCIRSEHLGYTVVVNGSPGMNTWSYQLNTTGFWTVGYDGDRWAYDISIEDYQFVTVNVEETIYLFNQSESASVPNNPDLRKPGSGMTHPTPTIIGQVNATAGQTAPVPVLIPIVALGIMGMILFRIKNG